MNHLSRHEVNRGIVLYQDRIALLRSAAFPTAIGAGLCTLLLFSRRSGHIVARLLTFLSGLFLLAWSYLLLPSLLRLLFPKPLVVVNQQGITYSPPSVGVFDFGASLAWNEIEALYPFELTINRPDGPTIYNFLCVVPRDVETFMYRRNLMNMTIMAILMNQTQTPFMIPESTLPISINALLTHLRVLYADELRIHSIEVLPEQTQSLISSKAL